MGVVNRQIMLPAVVFLIVSLGSIFAIDYFISGTFDNLSHIALQNKSEEGLLSVRTELEQARANIGALQDQVSTAKARRSPTLSDIKELANRHRLTIKQVERTGSAMSHTDSLVSHRLSVSGRIGRIVRFVRELEETHRLELRFIRLQADSPDGSSIVLSMQLQVLSS